MALKIIRKDIGTHEVGIMRHLRDSSIAQTNHAHPGRKFLAQLLDEFDVSATHTCLVLEIMGRSIASRAEEFIGGRLPGNMARQVSHQVALGLDYLWKCGVAHGGKNAYSNWWCFSQSLINRRLIWRKRPVCSSYNIQATGTPAPILSWGARTRCSATARWGRII